AQRLSKAETWATSTPPRATGPGRMACCGSAPFCVRSTNRHARPPPLAQKRRRSHVRTPPLVSRGTRRSRLRPARLDLGHGPREKLRQLGADLILGDGDALPVEIAL